MNPSTILGKVSVFLPICANYLFICERQQFFFSINKERKPFSLLQPKLEWWCLFNFIKNLAGSYDVTSLSLRLFVGLAAISFFKFYIFPVRQLKFFTIETSFGPIAFNLANYFLRSIAHNVSSFFVLIFCLVNKPFLIWDYFSS